MSVRVVARIRPLLEKEPNKDIIVRADSLEDGKQPNIVKIPNPKKESEEFSFTFNSVYDQDCNQEALFTAEVAPHLKALFQGLDVTIFAYGVTGTGKTHTMRGGLKLADRGVIPRLLSNVFRRGKKIMKDSDGETTVQVALSYYEIYNDKVFDLLEPPEKRTPSGLPLRENAGKTVVVGLSERSCEDLKDFEKLYIEANNNRVTAATKLNAHSSRSHAILRVKVTQTTGDMVRESTASAIDLAGSEDNRRTDNGKERLVESAAINKSLFVLSQCVDAISRGEKRIPYRESKMTRILSLGQNNGITVMILNLAPLRSYHLDTLSSLNVSSRAKRIEVREIENEIVYKQHPRPHASVSGTSLARQPLRPLNNAHNVHTGTVAAKAAEKDKPVKAFSVYTDAKQSTIPRANISQPRMSDPKRTSLKRSSGPDVLADTRPTKLARPTLATAPLTRPAPQKASAGMSAQQIEAIIERKVAEALAARQQEEAKSAPVEPQPPQINEAVQRRLEALEKRVDESRRDDDDGRSEGLKLLVKARQHKEMGDVRGALEHYEKALPFFPGQTKLLGKIDRLRAKLSEAGEDAGEVKPVEAPKKVAKKSRAVMDDDDEYDYRGGEADVDEDSFVEHARQKAARKARSKPAASRFAQDDGDLTPRKQQLLDIVNSRDVGQIKGLSGFGAKKARDLVDYLCLIGEDEGGRIKGMAQLCAVPGIGGRLVERAYDGLAAAL